jgi:hypothetical protein
MRAVLYPRGLGPFLHLLGSLEPLFPRTRHLVGVLENMQEGWIIFLSKPRDTNFRELIVRDRIHEPINFTGM